MPGDVITTMQWFPLAPNICCDAHTSSRCTRCSMANAAKVKVKQSQSAHSCGGCLPRREHTNWCLHFIWAHLGTVLQQPAEWLLWWTTLRNAPLTHSLTIGTIQKATIVKWTNKYTQVYLWTYQGLCEEHMKHYNSHITLVMRSALAKRYDSDFWMGNISLCMVQTKQQRAINIQEQTNEPTRVVDQRQQWSFVVTRIWNERIDNWIGKRWVRRWAHRMQNRFGIKTDLVWTKLRIMAEVLILQSVVY